MTSSETEPAERTPAYASFDRNADKLNALYAFISVGVHALGNDIDRAATEFKKESATLEQLFLQHEWWKQDAAAKQGQVVLAASNRLVEASEKYGRGLTPMLELLPVVMVTTVEAYLTDVLVYAAGADHAFMERSKQTASYAEVLTATSVEELRTELRLRWARNWIDKGGPSSWIGRLTNDGARTYSAEAATDMELLWGVRHLIVHSAGIVTADFVRWHPEYRSTAGTVVRITFAQLRRWMEVIEHFVDVTDCYFVRRLRPRLE